jgi:peptidyl-tRNA hydrolase
MDVSMGKGRLAAETAVVAAAATADAQMHNNQRFERWFRKYRSCILTSFEILR